MKTPLFWVDLWSHKKHFDLIGTYGEAIELVEAIQKDALSDPMVQISDQQEIELNKDIARQMEKTIERLQTELAEMRRKWHESRRYLRAANKGAERNAQVMQLQAHTIINIRAKIQS